MSGTPLLRRQPAQRRGAERVDRLLDACGQLLDEGGYQALTTRAVAERAGSSIGSFYQFFADKAALVAAFGQRNLDRFTVRIVAQLEAAPQDHWTGLVDVVLDEYVRMRRTVPGFGVVDFAQLGSDETSDLVARRLAELAAVSLEVPDTPELRRALRVAVEVAETLVRYAFRADPSGSPELLAEARQVILRYLEPHLTR
ncbi:MAG TPA: TetR/AcrR family transcriptional regulator [Jiangellaceae bacterium]